MFNILKNLKNIDYYPEHILDIGAYQGIWTQNMLSIYPDSKYYLFEAEMNNNLYELKNYTNIYIKNVILNDKIDEIDWYNNYSSGNSFFKEKTKFFKNIQSTKRQTIDLDTLINQENILQNVNNIFIKIDCQGAEISILKGCKSILNNTDFILLEIPLFGQYNENVPNFLEHIKFMNFIGFTYFDKLNNHYINNFNMQIDILFINRKSLFYKKYNNSPHIHSIMLSSFERNHVISYIKNKKKQDPNYTVIDIGGSAEYTNWSYSVIDYIVDINEPQNNTNNIKYFKLNVNFENDFKILLDYVNKHGKFDFCICSHIIEDISLPQVLLNNLKYIAKEGFIGVPSKYRELTKIEGNYVGYTHHRWIFSIKNNNLIGYPKLNFIDSQEKLINIGDASNNLLDLSFFWINSIEYSIINNNYMGPNTKSVIKYYDNLLIDDLDKIKKNNEHIYHIEYIKNYKYIAGNFILVVMLIDNLIEDLTFMDNKGYIPYNIIDNYNTLGKKDITIVFINKTHEFNKLVQDKLYLD